MKPVFILYILLGGLTINVSAQNKCEVLLDAINDNYVGGCKKGKAHGEGTAKGEDTYVGEFRKGLPNGQGKYTWANGDYYEGEWSVGRKDGKGKMVYTRTLGDSVVTGFWKNDRYVGEYERPFKVEFKQNVRNVKFTYMAPPGPSDMVEIVIWRNGQIASSVTQFRMQSTTPSRLDQVGAYPSFRDIQWPLNAKINYSLPNLLEPTIVVSATVEITIYQPGSWQVRIDAQ